MSRMCNLKLTELKEYFNLKGFTDIQFYEPKFSNEDFKALNFHSDFITYLDNTGTDKEKFEEYVNAISKEYTNEVLVAEVMDEEGYNVTVNANSCLDEDFDELYGNKYAEVLCVLLKKEVE